MYYLVDFGTTCFFFNDTATTEIYTLSLHDALPIYERDRPGRVRKPVNRQPRAVTDALADRAGDDHQRGRSEEHTSELQSHLNLVCRLLLEKKKSIVEPSCFKWRVHLYIPSHRPTSS